MEKIVFRNIDLAYTDVLFMVFNQLKAGKTAKHIDIENIKQSLGELYDLKFWHPTQDELRQWENNWFSTPVEQRLLDPKLKRPWNFESWIDAIQNADITLFNIESAPDGLYMISLSQNSHPSSGIAAMEELIKIFGGEVVENTML